MRGFASFCPRGETFVAHLDGLRTVGRQGVLPRGGKAILSCRLSDLLALHWVGLLAVLCERVICHQQNKASYKCESRHNCSVLLSSFDVAASL